MTDGGERVSVPVGEDTLYYCGTELLIHYDAVRGSLLPALLTLQIVLGTYHYSQLLDDRTGMALSFGLYLWFVLSELFVLGIMIAASLYLRRHQRALLQYLSCRELRAGEEGPVTWLARTPAKMELFWDKHMLVLGALIFLGCLVIGGMKFLGVV